MFVGLRAPMLSYSPTHLRSVVCQCPPKYARVTGRCYSLGHSPSAARPRAISLGTGLSRRGDLDYQDQPPQISTRKCPPCTTPARSIGHAAGTRLP
jgi:hypothetical protein